MDDDYGTLKRRCEELNWTLKERDNQLRLANECIDNIYRSTSWRVTAPLRAVKQSLDRYYTRLAWFKFLVKRTIQVARRQGVLEVLRKTSRYLGSVFGKNSIVSRGGALLNVSDHLNDRPLVSFVIPVYDRTEILKEAIESVLCQTINSFELILVTDGSPEQTLSVVDEYLMHPRVRIFHFPKSSGNAVRGRNKGILEARGEYIAFLDSDDIAMPHRLEKSLALLRDDQADVVYGAWKARIDGSREIDGLRDGQIVYSPKADLESLIKSCIPCQSSVIVRKSLLFRSGFLKPWMEYREDHELWARLAYFGGRFMSVLDVLIELRLHAGNNELNFQDTDHVYLDRLKCEYKKKGPIPKKIVFLLPGVGIGGGVAVILKHCALLMKAGHDVTAFNIGLDGDVSWFAENVVPVVHVTDKRPYVLDNADLVIATGWQTAAWLDRIHAKRKLYFVQSDERRFFDDAAIKRKVENTYKANCEYFTEAHWIRSMLKNEFGHDAAYVPNGLDPNVFYPDTPLVPKVAGSKLRVLLEGPIVIPYKGMEDAYRAVESLDCEIWIVSSAGKPYPNWRVDQFFESVRIDEMRKIYSACDVFLKMSRVEGFFGPPMEAMACGCAVVVGKVSGWDEYIVHESNALVVEPQDIIGARDAVNKILSDKELRERLIEGGKQTAAQWTWEKSAAAMLDVVNERSEAQYLESA